MNHHNLQYHPTASPALPILLCLPLFWACQSTPSAPARDHLLIEENGIFREQFDSTNVADTRYTDNNSTFKAGTEFLYAFKHFSREGEVYYFRQDPENETHYSGWFFVPADSVAGTTIQQVKISVQPGVQPMAISFPDYDQTVIKYEYPVAQGHAGFLSHSGVIENEKNVWMHPPRDRYFRILELNPFPFIKAPYEVGNQWEWELEIGSFWGDERWKTWEGGITNTYNYEITGKETRRTRFGELEVYEITGTANSRLGETSLVALFNGQYGFLQLDYGNIDGSRTVMELVEHKAEE